MNCKGQFSMIAALLVAVVLISTVIITYSTIRNVRIKVQPQVLNAIDETNLALKQILGFTVGYYGSVLQVTGNVTYAKSAAIKYLESGFQHIKNIHPEWGTSINLNEIRLHAVWFTSSSYSLGGLTVSYNLTGLGFYNLNYNVSCGLNVEVERTVFLNQTYWAVLRVLKDGEEPVINLGTSNFKFYNYRYGNLTWEKISPNETSSIKVYSNGTYYINMSDPALSTLDPYFYVVEITDSRGIKVMATSTSHYTYTLKWNIPRGYRVQRGRTLITDTQQDIPISPVSNLSRAFVMFNHYYSIGQLDQTPDSDGITYPNWGSVSAYLVNNTHIRVNRYSATSNIYIDWQVIECLDEEFKVYRGSYNWNSSSGTSFSVNIGATVNPEYCLAWVTGTTTNQNSLEAYDTILFRAYVSSPTQLTIKREVADANTAGTLRWIVVEFDPNKIGSIQTGSTTVDDTYTQSFPRQVTLNQPINPVHSILLFQIGVADSGLDQCSVAGRIVNETTIEFYTHGKSTQTRYIRYYVIDFGQGCGIKQSGTLDYSENANWYDVNQPLNPSVNVNRVMSFTSLTQDGTGTAFARPFPNAYVEDSTNYKIWRSRYGQEAYIEWQVLELPYWKIDEPIVIELLQNGTMRWLGQNLLAQPKPIPPIPVKAIHVNETINGVNREVPFQLEDWSSNYRIPLGLTSNASIFKSTTMLVFLANPNVSKVTIWWDGSDNAVQTRYAIYDPNTSPFKNDDPDNGILTNGILDLTITREREEAYHATVFKVISTLGDSSVTARFMRINSENSTYGADPSYVIYHGIIRDIIQQEAEWSSGASGCPNFYAHIVITLPANATYYTYQFRLMFLQSQQDRSIDDLSLIELKTTVNKDKWGSEWSKIITENGTSASYPTISYNTGFFYNKSGVWQHHWSEFIENNHGFGVMMTTKGNEQLYIFDEIAKNSTGGIKITNETTGNSQTVTMEIKPVELQTAAFKNALDTIWYGSVALFNGQKPIYPDGDKTTGLWMLVENPLIITVKTES
ncbi:hypothetical protein J7L49_01910 [Candidatus Bathyarchaeota archaeon]|nr:hypothetical protein [Candidatus Bathyarchaeota archaeon]